MSGITRLPRPMLENYEWQQRGLCRGSDVEQFFTDDPDQSRKARNDRTEAAKAVCAGCPVVQQCLDHALRVPEPYGIWGGSTASERARMLWDVAG
ncbi:WhiB family redox-sensing transcriptional regulator [Terracoccus luteus]|uniref:Transcriptional regulator WhiB n=1 Tax=Terracoccus luteus TaxID=53356 RepID=A0A495XVU9_9MICO|nr:WhiB family transcriptional regulator [Terracoccus luteus]RKT78701.1 WhiB family redox-sensing transcriptional regulator [Terracoccus luteus]